MPAMSNVPTFFFSHARQDTERTGNYLKKFFADLEDRVADFSGISLKETRLGTIDVATAQGENWDATLTGALVNNKAFVAILTPLYFNRPNCGKELAVFLLRHPSLGVDQNGALTGVTNVLPIRWLPELAYASNGGKDSLVPPILSLIEDTPAEDPRDRERSNAIRRYRTKGMARCVNVEPHYTELLDMIALRLRDMQPLPPGAPPTFASARNAFTYDWRRHFGGASEPAASAAPPEPVAPQPLSTVVVTYVTNRSFTRDPQQVDFAETLIAETPVGAAAAGDPFLRGLLSDVSTAAANEGLHVFHAALDRPQEFSPASLVSHLAGLSASKVMAALMIDSDIWPRAARGPLDDVIGSTEWIGPVLISGPEAGAVDADETIASRALRRRVFVVPSAPAERVAALARAFVVTRGDLLRAGTSSSAAEPLPVLKGVGPTRA